MSDDRVEIVHRKTSTIPDFDKMLEALVRGGYSPIEAHNALHRVATQSAIDMAQFMRESAEKKKEKR